MNKYFFFLITLLIFPFCSSSVEFNQKELIIHKGNDPHLSEDEGYLFLPFQTNTELNYITLDNVDSGRQIKFKDIPIGEHHALLKLKAGTYYWKSVRKVLGYGAYQFKYKKQDHQLVIKPGIVNYTGNWMFNIEWSENLSAIATLANTNKFSFEWVNYKSNFSQLVKGAPMEYVGKVRDSYPTKMTALLNKYLQVNEHDINYHGLPDEGTPIKYFKTSDGIDQQSHEFPKLETYVKNNEATVGELSPSGHFVLLHTVQQGKYTIEVLNNETFKSYVIFKQNLYKNTRVSNLVWIDNNSFLYNLDYKTMSSTHVVHLEIDQNKAVTGANQFQFMQEGVVVDPLLNEENVLLFANYSRKSIHNDGGGLYRIDTTTKKSIRKSFWKTVKHTRQFDFVIKWLTDNNGVIRAAVEIEYDKKEEGFLYHYWYLKMDPKSSKWIKIKTSTADDDTPIPYLLSDDGSFFYTLTNNFGEMKSIHKYSSEDFSYMGPFFEDPNYDITGIKLDPASHKIMAYSYVENGVVKLNFFNEKDDKIKFLREKNPEINLYVNQYNQATGNILVFGITSFSKGAWYIYNEYSKNIVKLMDVNPDYEKLPKGDTFVVKSLADDGVEIEGYLVKPSDPNLKNPPLVVIPHGGPIGVRDYADNDEMQHFFAFQGIATLKVNYRGSSGYGKKFQELGNGQWGEKIEADIHHMVLHSIDKYGLDKEKICTMGGSYGGYSALMLTVLYPEYYQCAVSMAGVMDLPLLFTGISTSNLDQYAEIMKKIVGDPEQDYDELVNKSPFYLADKLTKPIKLFHGELDDTVSLEQALRMQQILYILNKDADLTIFRNEAHSFAYINSIVYYLAESLKFIQQQLALPATAIPYEKEETSSVVDYITE